MISDYVITEQDCRRLRSTEETVGLVAYQMDLHNCQRVVQNGIVQNEGDVQEAVDPYPIAYQAIVPRQSECENLSVPVCLSSSHIAFGSIRMEPVFMILGQSCATAATLALKLDCPLQEILYAQLRETLERDGQILSAF